MPSSTITIRVNGKWDGSALEKAMTDLGKLGKDVNKASSLYTSNAQKIATLNASLEKSATSGLAKASTKLVSIGAEIESVGQKLSRAGESLTASLTVPLLAVGTYSGAMAVQYDTALANVRKVTDMTEDELQKLADSALELSTSQPVTAEQILNVEALGAQLGVADDALESFSMTVNGLDIATNMNAEQAGKEMQRFANIVGMSEDAYQNYGSTIVALGNNLATTESEISTMSLRLAAAGDIAGMSEPEILGLAGAMSSLGIRAEAGGSAMTTIMSKISKAVATGGADLQAYADVAGMSAQEFASAWKSDPMDALQSLLQGIHDLDEGGQDMNVTLSELGINEIRQSDAVRRLANDTSVLSDAVGLATSAWKENTALTDEVSQRNESMASRLQTLKNKVDAIAITVGGPLVNALIEALDSATPLIETVADAAQSFADMDAQGQQTVLALAAVAAGAGPVLSVVGKITQVIGSATQGIGHFGQNLAIIGDALQTTDGASVRLYQSTGTLAGKIGLAGNSAVRAAGDVSKYVDVWEMWYENNKKSVALSAEANAAINNQGKYAGMATEKVQELAAAKRVEADAAATVAKKNRALLDVWKGTTDAASDAGQAALEYSRELDATGKYSTSAAKSSNGLKGALGGIKGIASQAATGISGLISAFGPMLAVTAAVSLVTVAVADLAQRAEEAKRKQELLASATRTFGDIAGDAATGARSQAEGIGDIADKAEEALQSLADLNDQAADTMDAFYTESATLEDYVSQIEALAGKAGLTASEQERLKTAVEGYNSITGESVEVTDAANGVISASTDELRDNAQAWRENAEAQAYQQLALDYAQQLAVAELGLSQAEEQRAAAQQRLNDAYAKARGEQARYGEISAETVQEIEDANRALEEAEQAVSEYQVGVDSATGSLDDLNKLQALANEEVQKTSEVLSGFGEGFANSLRDVGVNLDDFAIKLTDAGISTDQLNAIGSENISALAQVFNGNIDQMIWAIQNYNSLPIVDKNGTVTMNDAQLVDARGNVYRWNNDRLEDKNGNVAMNDIDLIDAQGRVYTWNGSEIQYKSGTGDVKQNIDTAVAWRNDWNRNGIKSYVADAKISIFRNVYDTLFTKKGNAAGGIRLHADGGIRTHADGAIATRAVPLDIVGEAGAEAIVPLTNRRYAMPFVNMIATEVGRKSQGSVTNNYSLYIDGTRAGSMTPQVMEAVEYIFNTFDMTAESGV